MFKPIAAALLLAVLAPAASAQGKPVMKPGLWEIVTVNETSGSPVKRTITARASFGSRVGDGSTTPACKTASRVAARQVPSVAACVGRYGAPTACYFARLGRGSRIGATHVASAPPIANVSSRP